MATYLLLRDNKQLGPLTLNELTKKGLKAYDLVWVEGKSAAWRYPSEIEELKPYAPIVEEQPYDRFFKRPVAENKNTAAIPKEVVQIKEEPKVVHPERQYASISRGDNKVYVTMPSRNTSANTAAQLRSEPVIKNEPVEVIKSSPASESKFKEDGFFGKPGIREEFFQEVVAEKSQYVEKKQQQNKSLNKKFITPVLLLIGVIVLLGSGILIGLYIDRKNSSQLEKTSEAIKQTTVKAAQEIASTSKPDPNVIPASGRLVDNNTPETNQALNQQIETQHAESTPLEKDPQAGLTKNQQVGSQIAASESKKQEKKLPQISPKKIPLTIQEEPSVPETDNLGNAHRSASHRDDEISDKAVLKTNIADMVGLTANKYSVGTFGGISDLQVTVSNHSVYPLDLVVVEVQYIQANKKIFKTENIYFHNLAAGSASMQEAPKSPRGVKVQYQIVLINSKESGISYSN
jgi:hypothetical protein